MTTTQALKLAQIQIVLTERGQRDEHGQQKEKQDDERARELPAAQNLRNGIKTGKLTKLTRTVKCPPGVKAAHAQHKEERWHSVDRRTMQPILKATANEQQQQRELSNQTHFQLIGTDAFDAVDERLLPCEKRDMEK
jgi:hypothetical protein